MSQGPPPVRTCRFSARPIPSGAGQGLQGDHYGLAPTTSAWGAVGGSGFDDPPALALALSAVPPFEDAAASVV